MRLSASIFHLQQPPFELYVVQCSLLLRRSLERDLVLSTLSVHTRLITSRACDHTHPACACSDGDGFLRLTIYRYRGGQQVCVCNNVRDTSAGGHLTCRAIHTNQYTGGSSKLGHHAADILCQPSRASMKSTRHRACSSRDVSECWFESMPPPHSQTRLLRDSTRSSQDHQEPATTTGDVRG